MMKVFERVGKPTEMFIRNQAQMVAWLIEQGLTATHIGPPCGAADARVPA